MSESEWHEQALCRQVDPETHFAGTADGEERQKGYVAQAKRVCLACPVRQPCLKEAFRLDRKFGVQWGVWGGLSERERRKLLRQQQLAEAA